MQHDSDFVRLHIAGGVDAAAAVRRADMRAQLRAMKPEQQSEFFAQLADIFLLNSPMPIMEMPPESAGVPVSPKLDIIQFLPLAEPLLNHLGRTKRETRVPAGAAGMGLVCRFARAGTSGWNAARSTLHPRAGRG